MTSHRGVLATGLFAITITIVAGIVRASEIPSAEADFLRKQEVVFQLLWSSRQAPKNHPEVFERLRNYKLEDVGAACENHTHAKEFENHLHRFQAVSQDEPFAAFRDERVDEVRLLFDVLLCAKSFDEFAALVAWSHEGKVPQVVWIHAFAMALAHRKDTRGLRLPNLYEIVPHYFFETEVMVEAYRAKTGEIEGVGDEYVIEANHTSHAESTDSQLNYFRDDVGLNQFYFQLHNQLPFWLSCEEKNCNGIPKHLRGELYYHVHKTLLARYELERLSLGLGRVEDIDWEQGISTGYRSGMTHPNGWPVPDREPGARLPVSKYKFLEEVKHYESRLSKAIDLGELRTGSSSKKLDESSSFNDLCNALQGNNDSPQPKLYGSLDRLYRRLLGFAPEVIGKKSGQVAALEMPWTSLRDAGFFRMNNRILDLGLRFKRNLPVYTPADLGFDGIRIDYVHLDKLVTYLDSFESTLNHPRVHYFADDSAARKESCGPKTTVRVRQQRLNHKAFAYQIGVTSERVTKGVVRIFLGPKLDARGNELDLEDSIEQFYELDRWLVDLKQGSNKLDRSSNDSPYYSSDPQSSEAYNRDIVRALRTTDENLARDIVHSRKLHLGLPRRLLLPRGNRSGLGLRLVVCLHGLDGAKVDKLNEDTVFAGLALDGRDLGFPLDRPIDGEGFERLRNFMVKDVKVFHEDVKDVEKD
ncbi:hypothetical protein TSAR_013577 [Trichomalopsis sarcophagae]|uniref:Uncharacterized protein n=1 Tax=Trichomalopsis sarcophagae TaxID=543379 RepID=A0A232FA13_9HYME|nr:hypothetical protein TSAR_013577 [Trichomalopsis sarcophagae]